MNTATSAVLTITSIGLIAGVSGTGLGGLITVLFPSVKDKVMGMFLSFAAGVMFSVVVFDLIPSALELGSRTELIGSLLFGAMFLWVGGAVFRGSGEMNGRGESNGAGVKTGHDRAGYKSRVRLELFKTGLIVALGISIHNLAEGLAIGAGYSAIPSQGLGVALVIGIHDIPEGMAMAAPFMAGMMNRLKIFLLTVLAGLPTALGAFLGAVLGGVSPLVLCLCLGFSSGAMLYVSLFELIPGSLLLTNFPRAFWGLLIGIILGLAIILAM